MKRETEPIGSVFFQVTKLEEEKWINYEYLSLLYSNICLGFYINNISFLLSKLVAFLM